MLHSLLGKLYSFSSHILSEIMDFGTVGCESWWKCFCLHSDNFCVQFCNVHGGCHCDRICK